MAENGSSDQLLYLKIPDYCPENENRSRKVRFHELSGLFLLFTMEWIIFPDHLLDVRHFHSHFMDLCAIQNLTKISFIPCLFSYC